MTDRIRLEGIRVHGRHGVYPEEAAAGQMFVVDVDLRLDLTPAGRTDRLGDTLDYGVLAQSVATLVASDRWDLIERVAQRVADLVLEDPRVESVEVAVHKPEAPMPVEVDDVSVTIRRGR